ncbi:MAG TPA: TVP38/TMEM64 family protein [Anaeromyxobacteraceae bacterium]|nr:TVP38/TMEM64 family protein [Anaeromyxobacteraceae bacterium]
MRLGVPRASTAAALAVVATAIGVTVLVPGMRDRVGAAVGALSVPDAHGAVEAFRAYVLGYGAWAPVVSAALMVLQSIVAPLPAFVVTFANGLLFGWAWGALLSWTSAMAGAALCFWIARALGRPVVERLLGGVAALDVADAFFARHGTRAVLVARLLPFVPFDPISFGAGITSAGFVPFLVATGVGQLPATILYSYLGERLTGSVRSLFWLFSIVAALTIVGWAGRGALGALRGDAGAR